MKLKFFSYIFVGRVASAVIGILSIRMLTTILSPAEYGELAFFLITLSLLSYNVAGAIGHYANLGIVRIYHLKLGDSFLRTYFAALLLVLILITPIIYVTLTIAGKNTSIGYVTFILACSFLFQNATNQISTVFVIKGKSFEYVFVSLASQVSIIFFGYLMCATFGAGALNWEIGIALASLSSFILSLYMHKTSFTDQRTPRRFVKPELKSTIAFVGKVFMSLSLLWILANGYRYYAIAELNPHQFGVFSAGIMLALSAYGAVDAIAGSLFSPKLYEDVASNDPDRKSKAWIDFFQSYIIFSLSCTLLLLLGVPWIKQIVLSAEFQGAINFLYVGVIVELSRIFLTASNNCCNVSGQPGKSIMPNIVSLLAFAISLYALRSSSYSLAVMTSFVLSSLTYFFTLRSSRESLSVVYKPELIFKSKAAWVLVILSVLVFLLNTQQLFSETFENVIRVASVIFTSYWTYGKLRKS